MGKTQRSLAVQVRIHDKGTTTPVDGTVDFTLTEDELESLPTIGTQIVRPIRGRTESRSVTIDVVDVSGAFTSHLATSGRSDLLNRLVEYRVNLNAAGFVTMMVGRLTDYSWRGGKPPTYSITISDEISNLRRLKLFETTDTTQIFPWGIRWPRSRTAGAEVSDTEANFFQVVSFDPYQLSPTVKAWVDDDVADDAVQRRSDGSSNFDFLVAEINGVTYPIVTFDGDLDAERFTTSVERHDVKIGKFLSLWVYAPAHGFSVDDGIALRLYVDGAEPSDAIPLHIGTEASPGLGTHPLGYSSSLVDENTFILLEKILDTTDVRYNLASLQALQGGYLDTGIGRDAWRITGMLEDGWSWIEDQILGPNMAVALTNDAGEIAFVSLKLPNATEFDEGSAFTFDKDNIVDGGEPTLQTSTKEIVNVIIVERPFLRGIAILPGQIGGGFAGSFVIIDGDWAGDGLIEGETQAERFEHDNLADLLEHELTFELDSFETIRGPNGIAAVPVQEIFERYGDGAVMGALVGQYSTDEVEVGDFVIIDFEEYPDLQTNTRGGNERVVQIMSKVRTPADGIRYSYLDGGLNLQALAEPTGASIALCVAGAKHCVEVDFAGAPASSRIRYRLDSQGVRLVAATLAQGAFPAQTLRMPSNTLIEMRMKAVLQGRRPSDWTAAVNVTTGAITAPSAPAIVSKTGTTAIIGFTLGDAAYRTRISLDAAACAGATPVRVLELDPGVSEFELERLDLNTTHCVKFEHFDEYGGLSASVTLEFTTDPTMATCPTPAGILILSGLK